MPMFRCPICNSPLSVWGVSATGPAEKFRELADRAKTPWRDSTVQPMPTPVQFPIPRPPQSISHSWDVRTAVQAGFASGFMSALLSMPLAIAGSVTFPYISTIEIPWYFPLAVFCIATPLTFFAVSLHPRSILSIIEKTVQMDLNGDGRMGDEEEPELPPIKIEFNDTHSGRMVLDELPRRKGHPNGPFLFAQAILNERATFCEADAKKYAGLTRKLWRRQSPNDPPGWVDVFLNHGWAVDRGGRQGIELLERGEAVIEMLAHTEQ
jgi:hypothetical protein